MRCELEEAAFVPNRLPFVGRRLELEGARKEFETMGMTGWAGRAERLLA